ncbi:cation-transporting P-type ATPase [Williamsia sp.]|uniref:cation-translocating P-type ATPase n=1 Tax=Williamsia sp. TaxID=1872085 RepID=UPI001A2D4CA0|nr:cation-transporting P-type ATPase [Williamsia sp.]MBJ7287920.1 cation-transporting P-type ATPase [Williamsia sp.]
MTVGHLASHTDTESDVDPQRSIAVLFRDLHTGPDGLDENEAARRLAVHGPNELTRSRSRTWPHELRTQFTQPLAILLFLAAVLAWVGGTPALSYAVLAVILLNAAFAFAQEMQAEKAVDALAAILPATTRVVRAGARRDIPAREVVPGDVLAISEGDKISADAHIISGEATIDLSSLTGESMPVDRTGAKGESTAALLDDRNLVFSGSTCTRGELTATVTRTGMSTELGRIASLSQPVRTEPSPLERQVKRATLIIAAVALAVGAAFLPAGLAAGLGWSAAISFSIGLIVANVPEGLLPTITLALAAGVRELARRGAVVKRLSAVETLGSVTVICTDKTGTLTENRMRVTHLWAGGSELGFQGPRTGGVAARLVSTAAACTTAESPTDAQPTGLGDPTELALLQLASDLEIGVTTNARAGTRRHTFHFDGHLKRMSTIDAHGDANVVHTKGALETVLPCCTHVVAADGTVVPMDNVHRHELTATLEAYARTGLRVLAVAERTTGSHEGVVTDRAVAESGLTMIGLVTMVDPPRAGVAEAVADAHRAGIRIHVVTGDNGLTATEIARQVGIGVSGSTIVDGDELDKMTDAELEAVMSREQEIIFARVSPEAKLRIARGFQARGHVVAMTGDGVNDAPALRHADIGIAMGKSGTDVAREAATVVLTDDDFATIVSAVSAGRQVYDNVRKFVLYIFAHAVPEVVPFLIFALSGGAVPLPLTVLQILAIDLGTETIPALALGREQPEPGLMDRPPRSRSAGIIHRALLIRAWLLLGLVSAVLVMTGFFVTLWCAGWSWGDPTGSGTALHHAYLQATTITFVGIVACQIGTAFAARTDHASLWHIGLWSNRPLLWGIAFELVFTAAVVYASPLQAVFGTAALQPAQLAVVLPFPFIVWGADELVRFIKRQKQARTAL